MGMTASYKEATGIFIEELKLTSAAEISEMFENLYADETLAVCHLDKMWDGFHYFLTGISISALYTNHSMEDNLLSEAIVGSEGRDEGISWIYPERAKEIADALKVVDADEKWNAFSLEEFEESDIYMMSQTELPEEDLKKELLDIFEGFSEFFQNIADKGNGAVIVIG